MPSKEYEHFKDFSASDVPIEERQKIWMELSGMTEADFETMFAAQKLRQARVPVIGRPAPRFRGRTAR
jgi:hypothetical protein